MKVRIEFELDVDQYNNHYTAKHGPDFAWKAKDQAKVLEMMQEVLEDSFYDFVKLRNEDSDPLRIKVQIHQS